ncbi:GNAT family N-acetyltransferase [Alicyclobacillus sp.]|uniref:GNAT family N-acetyltransferase n=1 Tax=Alicyclobacillus sp. TaxID=61169 RepID=UPI0025BFDD77|nr:GNAT family N-acetyltransferase [Alicyclobacillus sp.]MCL6518186.1 GNAT family N-acetyltransferase [Alicyclobacillus sp.]
MEQMRCLGPGDAGALRQLAERIGWSFTPEQAALYVGGIGRVFGLWRDGGLVATAALHPYDGRVARLGNVMVDPAHRRQGLATRLLKACLAEARSASLRVCLVATEMGEPLYRKLGFETIEFIHRFVFDPARPLSPQPAAMGNVRRLEPGDLRDVVRLDERAFGASRRSLIEALFTGGAHAWAHMAEDGVHQDFAFGLQRSRRRMSGVYSGRVCQGFALGLQRSSRTNLGAVVADAVSIAQALVAYACEELTETRALVRLDVPGWQTDFRAWLAASGFREECVSPLMQFGHARDCGAWSRWFALYDPALG